MGVERPKREQKTPESTWGADSRAQGQGPGLGKGSGGEERGTVDAGMMTINRAGGVPFSLSLFSVKQKVGKIGRRLWEVLGMVALKEW